MWRIFSVFLIGSLPALAGLKNLSLDHALQLLDKKNLEIKVSKFEETMKKYDELVVEGKNWGSLTISLQALRSNDAGNVFGFKLQSREATFGDFGAQEFMNNFGACQNGDMAACGRMYTQPPENLNYPAPRNHFLTKLTYQVPLYTGGKLSEYKKITEKMYEMSRLDTRKLRDEKIYQVKKAFYDITLVNRYIHNLSRIRHNMQKIAVIALYDQFHMRRKILHIGPAHKLGKTCLRHFIEQRKGTNRWNVTVTHGFTHFGYV